jgi:hypothetical protein
LDANKTFLGIATLITVVMELPFFFYSNRILNRVGIVGCVIFGHLAFILRTISYPSSHSSPYFIFMTLIFSTYSFITSKYWVLPIEVLHGTAFSLMWTAAVTHFSDIAPNGREATFQVRDFDHQLSSIKLFYNIYREFYQAFGALAQELDFYCLDIPMENLDLYTHLELVGL